MATLKSRLNKLEGRQATTSKQSIVVFPGETKASVMAASGISADSDVNVWTVNFIKSGDIPGRGAAAVKTDIRGITG